MIFLTFHNPQNQVNYISALCVVSSLNIALSLFFFSNLVCVQRALRSTVYSLGHCLCTRTHTDVRKLARSLEQSTYCNSETTIRLTRTGFSNSWIQHTTPHNFGLPFEEYPKSKCPTILQGQSQDGNIDDCILAFGCHFEVAKMQEKVNTRIADEKMRYTYPR